MVYIKGGGSKMDIESYLWSNHKHMDEKMKALMKRV